MKLAYSTNAFTRTDIETAIKAIADLGYDGVELLCDRPHLFPGEVVNETCDKILSLLEHHNLKISNLNANTANGYFSPPPPENVFEPSLCNPDREMRMWRQEYTIHAIRLAKKLGAKCVSITSGHPRPGCRPERSIDIFVDSLKQICNEAERYNINIGIEYEPGLLVERATEVAEIIHRVNSQHLGVNLDIGHSYLDGENPEEAIQMLSGRIWNIHVEDIKNRKHYHLVPGDGDLPFQRYFDALAKTGYDDFYTVELYTFTDHPIEAGQRSLDFLTKLNCTQ